MRYHLIVVAGLLAIGVPLLDSTPAQAQGADAVTTSSRIRALPDPPLGAGARIQSRDKLTSARMLLRIERRRQLKSIKLAKVRIRENNALITRLTDSVTSLTQQIWSMEEAYRILKDNSIDLGPFAEDPLSSSSLTWANIKLEDDD